MHFSPATPPAFPSHSPPRLNDEVLAQRAYDALVDVVNRYPVSVMMDRETRSAAFGPAMATLCADARQRHLPVERVIIAVKSAWTRLPARRTQLGDVATDVLSSAISVCIEQYFAESERLRFR